MDKNSGLENLLLLGTSYMYEWSITGQLLCIKWPSEIKYNRKLLSLLWRIHPCVQLLTFGSGKKQGAKIGKEDPPTLKAKTLIYLLIVSSHKKLLNTMQRQKSLRRGMLDCNYAL